jgi:hypothetical protein
MTASPPQRDFIKINFSISAALVLPLSYFRFLSPACVLDVERVVERNKAKNCVCLLKEQRIAEPLT